MPVQFVCPCCSAPLKIQDLDDIIVKKSHDSNTWSYSFACCLDHLKTEEEEANRNLPRYRKSVYLASVSHANNLLNNEINKLRLTLSKEIQEFSETHDPDLERHYISAIWGDDKGQIIQNFKVRDSSTIEGALSSVNLNANYLIDSGFTEMTLQKVSEELKAKYPRVKELRSFIKDDKFRITGYWSQPAIDLN